MLWRTIPVSVRSKGGPAPTSSAARCSLPSFRRAMIATRSMVGSSLGGNVFCRLGAGALLLWRSTPWWRPPCRAAIGSRPQCFETFSLVTRTDEVQTQWRPGQAPAILQSQGGAQMEALETYTSALAVLSAALLLVAAGL